MESCLLLDVWRWPDTGVSQDVSAPTRLFKHNFDGDTISFSSRVLWAKKPISSNDASEGDFTSHAFFSSLFVVRSTTPKADAELLPSSTNQPGRQAVAISIDLCCKHNSLQNFPCVFGAWATLPCLRPHLERTPLTGTHTHTYTQRRDARTQTSKMCTPSAPDRGSA